jgi:hypothetical protein
MKKKRLKLPRAPLALRKVGGPMRDRRERLKRKAERRDKETE